jgi:DNA-binding LacI/PurR family transcriptional regulator
MSITLKDIADRTGVSPSVVSTVLSGRDNGTFVSKETRERVLKVAEELNYTPVRSGRPRGSRRLRRQRLDQFIGVWISDYDISNNTVLDQLQQSIRQYAAMQILSEEFDYDFGLRLLLSEDLSRLDMLGVIGLIVIGDTPLPRSAAAASLPTVLLGEIDHPPQEIVTVHMENFAAGRAIGDHLWEYGHRRAAFLAPSSKPRVTRQRWQGLQSVWVENGGALDGCVPAPYDTKSGTDLRGQVTETVKALFVPNENSSTPTALVCFNETVAAYALQALRTVGLSVPSNVSVVAFGDTPNGAEALAVALTTIRTPTKQLVTSAVAQLYSLAREQTNSDGTIQSLRGRDLAFPGELIIRDSSRSINAGT